MGTDRWLYRAMLLCCVVNLSFALLDAIAHVPVGFCLVSFGSAAVNFYAAWKLWDKVLRHP